MVEMQVMGLVLDEGAKAPILLLKEPRETRLLPVWVGVTEAIAISLALNAIPMPRPLTHDLLLNSIGALGAEVHSVELVDVRDNAYMAELVLQSSKGLLRLDSRPSDAVALALRSGKPVFASPLVLERMGTRRLKALESSTARLYPPEDAPELLAALFTMPNIPAVEDARPDKEKARPLPHITITVNPVRKRRPGDEAIVAPAVHESKNPTPLSDANLEDLLRSLDPETKYRM